MTQFEFQPAVWLVNEIINGQSVLITVRHYAVTDITHWLACVEDSNGWTTAMSGVTQRPIDAMGEADAAAQLVLLGMLMVHRGNE